MPKDCAKYSLTLAENMVYYNMQYKLKSEQRVEFGFAAVVGGNDIKFADTEKEAISLLVQYLQGKDPAATFLIEGWLDGEYIPLANFDCENKPKMLNRH